MKNRNKAILFVGIIAIAYFILSSKKKVNKPQTTNNQSDSNDGLVSNYNIVPLPDLKNYKFTSVTPIKIVGQTTSSPIIVATSR